jgi:zinc D-Ala-D-Ala carboxypeptidase
MQLSPHFSLAEFTASAKGKELGIENTPNAIHTENMKALCDVVLEPLRQHFGFPVQVLSGFRCHALNAAVGGSTTSQHTLGEAADIRIRGVKNEDIWMYISLNLNFDQVIAEKLKENDGNAGWIHVSHKNYGKQRGEALSFLGDKYVKGLQFI